MTSTRKKEEGILIKSVDLLARIQRCAEIAEKLRKGSDPGRAVHLDDAVNAVLSALVSKDLRSRFVVLPERVRQCYEVVNHTGK